jgi:hypothetical protein
METLKRFRTRYQEELSKVELELTDILTHLAEADFIGAYLGDQPEVTELRIRKADVENLERRRQHIGMILDRLDQVIPKQSSVQVPAPGAAGPAGSRPAGGNIRRY